MSRVKYPQIALYEAMMAVLYAPRIPRWPTAR